MYKSLDEIITENKSDHGLEGLIRILYRNVEERLLSIEEVALLASTTEEHFMELVEQIHEKKEDKDPKFPMLSAEVTRLIETEGGTRVVCEIMEHYENLAVKNANIEKIIRMLEKNIPKKKSWTSATQRMSSQKQKNRYYSNKISNNQLVPLHTHRDCSFLL